MTDDNFDPTEFPRKRSRLDSCPDGKCGGCYACLLAQGVTDSNDVQSDDVEVE